MFIDFFDYQFHVHASDHIDIFDRDTHLRFIPGGS
jgi:hypothetical protein